MKTSKKLVAMALVSCMAVGSTMNFVNAANVKADEATKSQVETQNAKPRGKVYFSKSITSGQSIEIHEDSNWWQDDNVAILKWTESKGPERLSIRIEQKIGSKWEWAASGSIGIGETIRTTLAAGGIPIRILAYKDAGLDGKCSFELELTH